MIIIPNNKLLGMGEKGKKIGVAEAFNAANDVLRQAIVCQTFDA